MILFDPTTFREIIIDETQLTEEEAEILGKLNKLQKRIHKMVVKKDMIW